MAAPMSRRKLQRRVAELEELLRVAKADADNQRELARSRGAKLDAISRTLGQSTVVTSYTADGGVTVTPTNTTYER